jgi:hypothetical protein
VPAQQPLDEKTLKKSLKRCGWPCRRPGTTTTWVCSLSFAHKTPHKLLGNDGGIRATAAGFHE